MELLLFAAVLLVAVVLPLRRQDTGTHNTGQPVGEIFARLDAERADGTLPAYWFEGANHATAQ